MATWQTQTAVQATPEQIIDMLTDPKAVATWSPIDFEVEHIDGDRLVTGGRARVTGRLASTRRSSASSFGLSGIGLYRTDDYGQRWIQVSQNRDLMHRPWYYTHVFADQKHRRVAIHLFPDTGANGFDHRSQAAARRAFEFSILFESG